MLNTSFFRSGLRESSQLTQWQLSIRYGARVTTTPTLWGRVFALYLYGRRRMWWENLSQMGTGWEGGSRKRDSLLESKFQARRRIAASPLRALNCRTLHSPWSWVHVTHTIRKLDSSHLRFSLVQDHPDYESPPPSYILYPIQLTAAHSCVITIIAHSISWLLLHTSPLTHRYNFLFWFKSFSTHRLRILLSIQLNQQISMYQTLQMKSLYNKFSSYLWRGKLWIH